MNKHEIRLESEKRMLQLKKGDEVTNICTTDIDQMHHCCFVKYVLNPYKNKYGVPMCKKFVKCRKYISGKYHISNFNINVIYKGHLTQEECDKLYAPIWKAEFST